MLAHREFIMSDHKKKLLKVENLGVRFPLKNKSIIGKKSYLYAVDDISFEINRVKP